MFMDKDHIVCFHAYGGVHMFMDRCHMFTFMLGKFYPCSWIVCYFVTSMLEDCIHVDMFVNGYLLYICYNIVVGYLKHLNKHVCKWIRIYAY